jgi:hypothetical protein
MTKTAGRGVAKVRFAARENSGIVLLAKKGEGYLLKVPSRNTEQETYGMRYHSLCFGMFTLRSRLETSVGSQIRVFTRTLRVCLLYQSEPTV